MEEKIRELVQKLKEANLPKSDFVKLMDSLKDPYLVLIFCILSLRTKDTTTYPAALRLFEIAKTPEEMSKIDEEIISKAIYPVGFYLNKSKQIKELSIKLLEEYDGKVPRNIDELCKFNGVGRKTANLTLSQGYNIPAICVDVHVHRIFNRIGYVSTSTPDETELVLRQQLPQDLWIDINSLLVTLGQNICKPTKPNCSDCPIARFCEIDSGVKIWN